MAVYAVYVMSWKKKSFDISRSVANDQTLHVEKKATLSIT